MLVNIIIVILFTHQTFSLVLFYSYLIISFIYEENNEKIVD